MLRIPTHRPSTHPGEMLREEFMVPLSLSQRELARRLRVSRRLVSDLVHERRGITAELAVRLERLLGWEAQAWMNLQMVWDLYYAQRTAGAKKIRRLPAMRIKGRRRVLTPPSGAI